MRLLASPTIASKRWIYRQYDYMVRTNTIALAGLSAGVVRVKGTDRALAMSVDGNGRFCYLDPRQGARLALAEAARNVACAGAAPIGATNCLNFGNPERPEIMWQFAEAVAGLGEACRALDIPITGGNVSLYNETDGRAVLPSPVIGVVGVAERASSIRTRVFPRAGLEIVLVGDNRGELGGSEWLSTLHGLLRGRPPVLDLDREKALQTLLVGLAAEGRIQSAHDCAEGGWAVALAECWTFWMARSRAGAISNRSWGANWTRLPTSFRSASRPQRSPMRVVCRVAGTGWCCRTSLAAV
jgi:phosphoribosylformylglycinamidine synthase